MLPTYPIKSGYSNNFTKSCDIFLAYSIALCTHQWATFNDKTETMSVVSAALISGARIY